MGAAGSAVAVETADIALMGDNLLKLPEAISLARRTVANMRQNIAIALITVSLLMLGVLLGGATMAVGMLVHEVSVLVVILNADASTASQTRPQHVDSTDSGPCRCATAGPSAWLSLRQGWSTRAKDPGLPHCERTRPSRSTLHDPVDIVARPRRPADLPFGHRYRSVPLRPRQACGGRASISGWSLWIRPSLAAPPGLPRSSKNSTLAL